MPANKTILVVEDDQEIRDTLCEILSSEGYVPIPAAHGREGLEQLSRAPALPELIIFDLMMPVMDGREFRRAQLADARVADVPAVLITAGSDPQDAAKQVHAAAYLRKPFDLDELFATVERLTER